MVPSTYDAGKLYNVLPSGNRAPDSTDQNSGYDQTRADFDFDRGSNAAATRIDENGVLQKYRENLLLQSNSFDTTWVNARSSETSGQSGYDGTNNAWLLSDAVSVNNDHIIYNPNSHGGVVTYSVYAKANTLNWFELSSYSGGTTINSFFDLENGAIGSGTNIEAKIEAVGTDGWYRCSVTGYTTTNNYVRIALATDDNTTNWVGTNGDNSIYIQNAQLETGLVATDYLESTSVTGKAGVLVDLPRINYDANGENGALLLEPQRTNVIPSSEDIDSVWSKLRVSVENNSTTSPEGFVNAGKTTATAVAGTHASYDTLSGLVTAGNDYFISCFLKKATTKYIRLNEGYTGAYVTFNFDDQTTDLQNGASDVLLEEHANGWYRLGFKFTADSSGNSQFALYINDDNNNTSYTGAGEAVYLWGAQIEAGSYATSYIPNNGSTAGVTRSFDNATTTSEEDVLTSGEGVVFMDFEIKDTTITGYPELIRIENPSDTTDKFWFYIYNDSDAGEIRFGYRLDDTAVKKIEGSITLDTTTTAKVAMRLENNNYALYYNGTKQTPTQYAGVVSNLREITTRGREYFNGLGIKQFAIFNEPLSDSELATLTTL